MLSYFISMRAVSFSLLTFEEVRNKFVDNVLKIYIPPEEMILFNILMVLKTEIVF